MELVKIEKTSTGFSIDPNPYLDVLAELRGELPPGAWSFVSDSGHYDFYSERCVKDLRPISISVGGAGDDYSVMIRFAFNSFAPEQLHIRYSGVSVLLVKMDDGSTASNHVSSGLLRQLGPVLLDEVMPHEYGCVHEIKLTGGQIRVVCADLQAEWISPDRQ
jgi:hypothetical protein